MAPALHRLSDLIFTTDRQQRTRLVLSGLASLLMLVGGVAVLTRLALIGDAKTEHVAWWTVCALAGPITLFGVIRSGWNLRLADPALTVPQMVYAIACSASGYAIAGPAHASFAMTLPVILSFGMFALSPKQVRIVAVWSLLAYGVVCLYMTWTHPTAYTSSGEQSSYLMIVLNVMASWILASRLIKIRARLRSQREELKAQQLELQQAFDRIHQIATHDELTGLVNRRHTQSLMLNEQRRSQRSKQPFCIGLLDIDHFKRVNDQYGHAAGDEVLRTLAAAGLKCMRTTDVMGRWGGEEFVLILPNTRLEEALIALERFRVYMATNKVQVPNAELVITFSAGLAEHQVKDTLDHTLERADRALYEAKGEGRNRIVLSYAASPPSQG